MKKTFIKFMCLGALLVGVGKSQSVHAEDNSGFPNPEYMDLLDQYIHSENKFGLTGTQLAIYKDGNLIKNDGYGFTNNYYNYYDEYGNYVLNRSKVLPVEERNPVDTNNLFDMASNTKMYATVYAMQKLVSEKTIIPGTDKAITLDTKISEIFPEFLEEANEKHWKDDITVGLVLSHYAGFAPDPQYHNENYDKVDGIENGVNDLFSQDKQTTFQMIMKTPLTTKPGTAWAYSDVDMMLGGFIVEYLTGQDLDAYVKESFYQPLGLDRVTFNPLQFGFDPSEIASTELHGNTRDGQVIFKNARMDVITGQVHDEKAFYSMEGMSGHAGLFGTAQQIAYLEQAMINGGELDGIQLFDQESIDAFIAPATLRTQTQGGWRRKSEDGGAASWFSEFAPAGTIGHTGWTGTNTMIDFENQLTLSLMTNCRNTPLMGDANTFYTENSNISTYGTVSEFAYRGLGLANDKYDTPQKVLEKMIVAEIPKDLSSQTSGKRNVIRALLDTLATRAETDEAANTYQQTELIQNTLTELKKYEAKDLRFLVVTKALDEGIAEGNAITADDYSVASYRKVKNLVKQGENLIARDNFTQEAVDELANDLQDAIDGIVYIGDLRELVNQAEQFIEEDYTAESWEVFENALTEATNLLETAETQATVDEALATLQNAMDGLVEVSQEVEEITLNVTRIKILKKGEDLQLETTITPSDANVGNLTFESNRPEIATVDENGHVIGVKAGTAKITVTTENGKTASFTLRVTK